MAKDDPVPHSPDPISQAVDLWFLETFPGSAIAQSTTTWNLVFVAKEDLKRRLSSSRAEPEKV